MGSSGATGYTIDRSVRFDKVDDDQSFDWTPSSDGNRKTWTFSCWNRRSTTNSGSMLLTATSGSLKFYFRFLNHQLDLLRWNGSSSAFKVTTNRYFRDNSSWYHIVLAFDTTQATASNRVKFYINGGAAETSFASSNYPSQDSDWHVSQSGYEQSIGFHALDGYMAEVNFIDGQALDGSHFGETDETTGQWIPKKFEGTYGSHGYFLNFADNSGVSATTLGKDSSGNGNNFTPNNVVAGDSVLETPHNKFCTLNPQILSPQIDFGKGDLYVELGSEHKSSFGTMAVKTGKWYFECRASGGSLTKYVFGITDEGNSHVKQVSGTNYLPGSTASTYTWGDVVTIYMDDLYKNGTKESADVFGAGVDIANTEICGVAFDADTGKVWFHREGTWINGSGSASTTLDADNHDETVTTGKYYLPVIAGENVNWIANFGQDGTFAGNETAQNNTDSAGKGNFYYTVPSGFKALCSANIPTPTIKKGSDYFNTILYTGNGSASQSKTGVGFQPDLVWIKSRSFVVENMVYDSVRGTGKDLRTNDDADDGDNDQGLNAFNSDGFSIGTMGNVNQNGETFVAWNWKESATAGFDIVSYTGDGNSPRNIAHNLGVAPEVVIVKRRNSDEDWFVNVGPILPSGKDGHYLKLNTNASEGTAAGPFNSANPTSSHFVTQGDSATNADGDTYIAYCFSGVEGYSKFGHYEGNGSSDGTFVYTGFKPAFILAKTYDHSDSWHMFDSTRDTDNLSHHRTQPNLTDAESTSISTTTSNVDIVSNGFKWRGSSNDTNGNNNEYIYLAFAERPFKYANAR